MSDCKRCGHAPLNPKPHARTRPVEGGHAREAGALLPVHAHQVPIHRSGSGARGQGSSRPVGHARARAPRPRVWRRGSRRRGPWGVGVNRWWWYACLCVCARTCLCAQASGAGRGRAGAHKPPQITIPLGEMSVSPVHLVHPLLAGKRRVVDRLSHCGGNQPLTVAMQGESIDDAQRC